MNKFNDNIHKCKIILKNNIYFLQKTFKISPLYILVNILLVIVSALRTTFLSVYLINYIIVHAENKSSFSDIQFFLIISSILLIFSFILEAYAKNVYLKAEEEKISQKLQVDIFSQIPKMDYENNQRSETFNSFFLSSKECDERIFSTVKNTCGILEGLVVIFSIIGICINLDKIIVIVSFLSFVVSWVVNLKSGKAAVEFDEKLKTKERKDDFLKRLILLPEHSLELRISKIINILEKEMKINSEEKFVIIKKLGKRVFHLDYFNSLFSEAIILDFFLPIYLIFKIVIFKTLPIGSFVALINAAYQIKYKMEKLVSEGISFYKNGMFIERYKAFKNLLPNEQLIKLPLDSNHPVSFETLTLNNICFSYQDDSFSIENINLKINKGEKIAIVGENGSGKSTLINLILKLFSPSSGNIMLNDTIDINEISTEEYRKIYSILFQDFQIYATEISKNISMDKGYSISKIYSATQKTQFDNVVLNLAQEYHTELTKELDEDGIEFSGGEQQRLAMSRNFYSDSSVFIFDEPTSALDIKQEEYFYSLIEQIAKEKTIIFTSHRLSSAKMCDKIYFLSNGRIAEEGTHEELMKKNGAYAKLYQTQKNMFANC